MKQLHDVAGIRAFRQSIEGAVGFVPTMGALHEGHLSLVEQSCIENEHTIVSIYVNPTQFNNANDLSNYPDTLETDLDQVRGKASAVFLPDYRVLYPDDFAYQVDEKVFSNELCGAHRPGHFTGVLTVVMKLLNIVKPDRAYFGEKDYQQLHLVRGMARAFFLDTEIIGCPIIREDDGLAMSSRNLNLPASDRAKSPKFNEILRQCSDDATTVAALKHAGFEVDYVQTIDGRRFGAVMMGTADSPVRLIDNVPTK